MAFAPIPENYKVSNTVSSQVLKTFSSSVQSTGSAADGLLKSNPTSIGGVLDNINAAAGALGRQGMAVGTAISQAVSKLGSLGSYSKFSDNFTPPSKLRDLPPESTSKLTNGYKASLVYPEDLGQYFIIFTFKKYSRKIPLSNPINIKEVSIALPIPTNLQEAFNMQYSDMNLGLAGLIENILPNFNNSPEDIRRQTAENVKSTIDNSSVSSLAFYGARTLTGITDATAGALEKAGGAVKNPYQALLFQGINLRTHSFNYRFSPSSEAEHKTLKRIIYEFKSRMHPTRDSLLYLFPDVVDIKFGKKDSEPYFFKTCFLESMSLNYAPQGTPAFFAQTADPVEVEMSLNFKETTQVTRADFKDPDAGSFYDGGPE